MKEYLELLTMPMKAKTPVIEMTQSTDNVYYPKDFKPSVVSKPNKSVGYNERFRSQWHAPEYNFSRIQVAQDVDSLLSRSINKAVDKFVVAGWEFVAKNEGPLNYVKRRLYEIAVVSGRPFELLIVDTFHDLRRYKNGLWVKTRNRNASTGKRRRVPNKVEPIDPVACYTILPFETLELKTSTSGEIESVRQRLPHSKYSRSFSKDDIVHFYFYKKPGFTTGTPDLLPALDDIQLLRRIEENVEELIETNLFPVYHYQIGSDSLPERYIYSDGENLKESDVVRQTLEYMPAGGMYITDHRHRINVLGSESKALRIEGYLQYFLKRAIAAMGMTSVDLGIDGDANRSTANTLTKTAALSIQSIQQIMKFFLEFYVINELLLEGGYNPGNPEHAVEITFGTIDKDEKIAEANSLTQQWTSKAISLTELRKGLGYKPADDDYFANNYYTLIEEPLAMLKLMESGAVATEVMTANEMSNVEPSAVSKGRTVNEKIAKLAKPVGAPGGQNKGPQRANANKLKPANQHGTRSGPKLSKDYYLPKLKTSIKLDHEVSLSDLDSWENKVLERMNQVDMESISIDTLCNIMKVHLKG